MKFRRISRTLAVLAASLGIALCAAPASHAYTWRTCVRSLEGVPGDNDAYRYLGELWQRTGVVPRAYWPITGSQHWYDARRMRYDFVYVIFTGWNVRVHAYCISRWRHGGVFHDEVGRVPTGWYIYR